MSSASARACPIEEVLVDDPLTTTGSEAEKNTLDRGELVAAGLSSLKTKETISTVEEAILVKEEANRCYTCHQVSLDSSEKTGYNLSLCRSYQQDPQHQPLWLMWSCMRLAS